MDNVSTILEPALSATVETRDLKNALTLLAKVAKPSYISTLACVLLRAHGDVLTLTVYNLDQELTIRVNAETLADGEVCVNAKEFLAFVKSVGVTRIALKQNNLALNARAGDDLATLPTLSVADFPIFDAKESTHDFVMPAADLRLLIAKTAFAVSTEGTRYYLNGIYMHISGDKLRSVSTDGHRLAWQNVEAPNGSQNMPGGIVPNAALPLIDAITKSVDAVTIHRAPFQLSVVCANATLRTKLIDGTFPDYARCIPTTEHSVEIDRKAFIEKLKMLTAASSRFSAEVKLDFGGSRMTLTRRDPERGDKTAALVCVCSESCEIGFNGRYLISILEIIDAPRVRLDFADAQSPAILCAAGSGSQGRYETQGAVIMPMRV